MKIEILVSTMHQKDNSLIHKMNILSDAIIINQCDKNENKLSEINGRNIKLLSYKERGLSKSRNRAIENATGDICIIADDDLTYKDDYIDTISKAYKELPDADIIIFDVPSTNIDRPTSYLGNAIYKMGFRMAMKVASFRITFKLEPITRNKLRFNELFGAGSTYAHGEENIFIKECLKKGLNIYYYPKEIAIVSHADSTWFKGYKEKFFYELGAIYYELFGKCASIFILRFLLVKIKLYHKDISIWNAFKSANKGINEYRNIVKNYK